MIGFSGVNRFYLYTGIADMRKSFHGLSGLVLNEMQLPLRSGDGFVFINKRRTMIKILIWDRTGFVIYYKQLSSGTIEFPQHQESSKKLEISMTNLMLILEGVQLKDIKWRKRFREENT